MGIGKKNAAPGQAIYVWHVSLRMPAQTANPIIEVINGNEQDVRSLVGPTELREASEESERCKHNDWKERSGELFHTPIRYERF
jgi:hypothetical protein